MKIICICIVFAAVAAGCASGNQLGSCPEIIYGRAIWIHDGDTLTLLKSDKTWRTVRLYGIDAPELNQPYGAASRDMLIALLGRKRVKVEIISIDRYGRSIGKIYCGKSYINLEMVSSGAAWWYQSYAPRDVELETAEQEARRELRGLWKNSSPVSPWEYRRAN